MDATATRSFRELYPQQELLWREKTNVRGEAGGVAIRGWGVDSAEE